jgi:anti-anti-sigma factor
MIFEEKNNSILVFRFIGTITGIDTINIVKIVETSSNHEYKQIFIDLNKVTFIDSNALGGFIFLNHRMKRDGIAVTFCRPQEKVRELLHNYSLDKVITISESFTPSDTPEKEQVE